MTKKLINLSIISQRPPNSFYEAVLLYFIFGGKVRKKDAEFFLGRKSLKSGIKGNGYLSYINNNSEPYDKIILSIGYDLMNIKDIDDLGDQFERSYEFFQIFESFYFESPHRKFLKILEKEEKNILKISDIKIDIGKLIKNYNSLKNEEIFNELKNIIETKENQLDELTKTFILDNIWEYIFYNNFKF